MKFKTWHFELSVVAIVLCGVTYFFHNDLVNWITCAAMLVTFNHGIIGDRLQERQANMSKPTVECYYKLNRLFYQKEILWIAVFLLSGNYAAIAGSVMFFLYPFWRRYYRKNIKPLDALEDFNGI